MKDKLILLLFIILLLPTSAKAFDFCSNTEKARLRKLASNVTTSYDYVEVNGEVTFNITLTNLNEDLYIYETAKKIEHRYNNEKEIILTGYEPGSNVKFEIYTSKEDCFSKSLIVKNVNLPYYNKYYNDPLCQGKSYSICSKWQKVSMTRAEFEKKMNEYKEAEEEKQKQKDLSLSTIFDYISNFVFENYLYIIIGVLVITFGVRFIINKRNAFDL
ncbi:MAG: hypothetical protein IJ565_03745 [Bacilli bacterium]|nr:hypothetical protein [Bacilli bacterium]